MKAVVLKKFGGSENISISEVDDPLVVHGTVKNKIVSTSFNPIDIQMRVGDSESSMLRSNILGRELSGIIIELHPSVSKFKIGDEIYAYAGDMGSNGSYAELIVIPASIIALKPKGLSFDQASAIPLAGQTALQAVDRSGFKKFESVFISGGTGSVGSMIMRLLLMKGIKDIFTTAGNCESKNTLISYGMPEENILDYKDMLITQKLLSLGGHRKFSHCFDTVGGQMSELCAELLMIHGVIADTTYLMTELARAKLFDKGCTIINVSNYSYGFEGDKSQLPIYGRYLNQLTTYIENKSLPASPINVIGNLSVETVRRVHDLIENNRTKGRKMVMRV